MSRCPDPTHRTAIHMPHDTLPLAEQPCMHREGAALQGAELQALQAATAGWQIDASQLSLSRTFTFDDYHRTMAFVNAVAWIAHQQDHHPDLQVGYNRCTVTWSTHSVGGLSLNDFICAARVDALSA